MTESTVICVYLGSLKYQALVDPENAVVKSYTFYKEFGSIVDGINPGDMFVLTQKRMPASVQMRADKIDYKESLRHFFEA